MQNLISVIVPCYNQASYLSEALDSVLNQSYINWECIIVNDGSTDDTEGIAQQYTSKDSRFNYLKQVNGGLSNARNSGIAAANGQFIQLLDADDLIEKDKLKSTVELYSSGHIDDRIIIYSSMRYFEHKQPDLLKILGRQDFVAHIEIKQDDDMISQKELLKARNPFVISAPLYPATLFDDIGYFDESLRALEDWDFHLRCIAGGYKFHHYYYPLSRTLIRMHDSSMMRDQKLMDDNFYKLIFKHQLRVIEPVKKEAIVKKIVREITPPILIKLFKKIF